MIKLGYMAFYKDCLQKTTCDLEFHYKGLFQDKLQSTSSNIFLLTVI